MRTSDMGAIRVAFGIYLFGFPLVAAIDEGWAACLPMFVACWAIMGFLIAGVIAPPATPIRVRLKTFAFWYLAFWSERIRDWSTT